MNNKYEIPEAIGEEDEELNYSKKLLNSIENKEISDEAETEPSKKEIDSQIKEDAVQEKNKSLKDIIQHMAKKGRNLYK